MKSDYVIYFASRDPHEPADRSAIEVTVNDGEPHGSLVTLTPAASREVHDYAAEFDWGRESTGCRQLALAMLLDFLGPSHAAVAWQLHTLFADRELANLPIKDFRYTGAWLRGWSFSLDRDLTQIEQGKLPDLPGPS